MRELVVGKFQSGGNVAAEVLSQCKSESANARNILIVHLGNSGWAVCAQILVVRLFGRSITTRGDIPPSPAREE